MLREIEHSGDTGQGLLANGAIDMNLTMASCEAIQNSLKVVHGHPGAVGTAFAGGTITGGGRLYYGLAGRELLHAMKEPFVGGHNVRRSGSIHDRTQ